MSNETPKKTKSDLKQLEAEFDRVAMDRYRIAMMTVIRQEVQIAAAFQRCEQMRKLLPDPSALREASIVLQSLSDTSYRQLAQQLGRLAFEIDQFLKSP